MNKSKKLALIGIISATLVLCVIAAVLIGVFVPKKNKSEGNKQPAAVWIDGSPMTDVEAQAQLDWYNAQTLELLDRFADWTATVEFRNKDDNGTKRSERAECDCTVCSEIIDGLIDDTIDVIPITTTGTTGTTGTTTAPGTSGTTGTTAAAPGTSGTTGTTGDDFDGDDTTGTDTPFQTSGMKANTNPVRQETINQQRGVSNQKRGVRCNQPCGLADLVPPGTPGVPPDVTSRGGCFYDDVRRACITHNEEIKDSGSCGCSSVGNHGLKFCHHKEAFLNPFTYWYACTGNNIDTYNGCRNNGVNDVSGSKMRCYGQC